MATEKPFGAEVAFNTAGENDGKFHSFCEEEIAELLPRNKANGRRFLFKSLQILKLL